MGLKPLAPDCFPWWSVPAVALRLARSERAHTPGTACRPARRSLPPPAHIHTRAGQISYEAAAPSRRPPRQPTNQKTKNKKTSRTDGPLAQMDGVEETFGEILRHPPPLLLPRPSTVPRPCPFVGPRLDGRAPRSVGRRSGCPLGVGPTVERRGHEGPRPRGDWGRSVCSCEGGAGQVVVQVATEVPGRPRRRRLEGKRAGLERGGRRNRKKSNPALWPRGGGSGAGEDHCLIRLQPTDPPEPSILTSLGSHQLLRIKR